jgi:pantothenate kinase type III
MAITTVNVSTPAVELIYTDTAIGNALDAIKASSTKLYYVIIDNSANVAATYVKLFNVASGSVTLGTTAPDEVIYVPASSVITHMYFTGAAPGITFGTALTASAVTTGGTGGTVSPSSSVIFTASYV